MSKNEYPRLWQLGIIQKQVRKRANHQCEQCGIQFYRGTNLAKHAKNYCGNPIVGGCHHIDMDKANNTKRNLVYLCQKCHFTIHLYDWKPGDMIPLRWKNNIPKWIVERELPYIDHIQIALFGGDL